MNVSNRHRRLIGRGCLGSAALLSLVAVPTLLAAQDMMSPTRADTAAACRVEQARVADMMTAAFETFEGPTALGWRSMLNIACHATSARLIAGYVARNSATLSAYQLRILAFHAGQALAYGRSEGPAMVWFRRAAGGDDAEWNGYVGVTLAFLERDRREFDRLLATYQRLPLTPSRRAIVGGLAACFDRPYAEASMCTPAQPTSSPPGTVRQTEHTLESIPGAGGPSARLSDVEWLSGTWRGTGLGGVVESTWSDPIDRVMLGTMRLHRVGKPVFFELTMLVEEDSTVVKYIKHFGPDLKGWEDRDASQRFALVRKTRDTLYFTGMTYVRAGDSLIAYVAIRQEGRLREEKSVSVRRPR